VSGLGGSYPDQAKDHAMPSDHSGAGRTKARSALNTCRAAHRVSEANNPGNETNEGGNWIPACADVMTVVLA